MAYATLISHADGLPAFTHGTVLTGFFERTRGLIGAKAVRPDEAWVFPDCRSVHTWFMGLPIDIICLDAKGVVLSVETVRPWKLPRCSPETACVIETASNGARRNGITAGSRLCWKDPGR